MKLLLITLLMATALQAQTVMVSVSHQPLALFKAAFLSKIDRVGLYQAIIYNPNPSAVKLYGGAVLTGIETGDTQQHRLHTLQPDLNALTAQYARKNGFWMRLLRFVQPLSSGATVLAGTDALGHGVVTTGILAGITWGLSVVTSRSTDEQSSGLPPETVQRFLRAEDELMLGPGVSQSRLFFAVYAGNTEGFQVLVPALIPTK